MGRGNKSWKKEEKSKLASKNIWSPWNIFNQLNQFWHGEEKHPLILKIALKSISQKKRNQVIKV